MSCSLRSYTRIFSAADIMSREVFDYAFRYATTQDILKWYAGFAQRTEKSNKLFNVFFNGTMR
jgi:hypothetical protein